MIIIPQQKLVTETSNYMSNKINFEYQFAIGSLVFPMQDMCCIISTITCMQGVYENVYPTLACYRALYVPLIHVLFSYQ
jgi:hypothetical protein